MMKGIQKIPKGWMRTALWDFSEIIMGQSPNGESYNQSGDGIPFYQGITEFWERFVRIKTYTTEPTKIVSANTILFSVRAPVGKVNFTQHEACIGRGNAWIVSKNGETGFLFYLLRHIEREIKNRSSGTVFDSISWKELKEVPIIVPENELEQRAIADVLSSFDDKIELLRKQNETLEKTASTLFSEWFGKYRIEDELPEGWTFGKLTDIATFLNGLALQRFPPESEKECLPVIKIRELKAGITEQSDKASKNIDPKYVIKAGDVLFSWSWSLEVGIWHHQPWALNQHLFKISSEKYPKWFYYFWTRHHLPWFKEIAAHKATTMGHIQRGHLDMAVVVIPDSDSISKYGNTIEPLFEKALLNALEIQRLGSIRDIILPKLMDGEKHVGFLDS